MKEREIEEKLRKAVRQKGGVCWKFTSPGTAGVPDRILLMPKGRRFASLVMTEKRGRRTVDRNTPIEYFFSPNI